jgi:hypothetical protein
MSRATVTVWTSYEDPETGDETDIEVTCAVSKATRPTHSRSWGWQPGDPAEVEIVSAVSEDGKDWLEAIERDARWLDRVEEQAIDAAQDDDGGEGDRLHDEMRDRALGF